MRIQELLRSLAALVLAIGAGLIVVSAASADNKPVAFHTFGIATAISEGDVEPAGTSGRFVVKHRMVFGGLLGPDLAGSMLTLDYGTNVPLLTQQGPLHGKFTIVPPSPLASVIEGTVRTTSSFGLCPILEIFPVPALILDGSYAFNSGAQGNGDVTACVWALLDPLTGHVTAIAASIDLDGKWKP